MDAGSPGSPGSPGCHNLPTTLTRFVGRERDLRELPHLLQENRLLTLTGPGGVGKTRLALELAREALRTRAGDWVDGVWLVDLAPVFEPRLVASVAASALGVPEVVGQPMEQTLAQALARQRLLLVLDNCEHVLATAAVLVEELLRRCPEVRVLATSREALNVAGEVAWLVPSLALDAEAVHLFVDRAAAALPAADPTRWSHTTVREICRRLDGIPLAIELAATRVKALSVEQIAVRLDDRFRLLAGGMRTALPRHQTLRALVDWSYELLSDQERTFFRRLAVFAGSWTLAAAEAVCSGDGIEQEAVLDLLSHLVEKSLVAAEVAEERGGQYRYRLLETLRQYAAEQLAAGEADALRTRHLTFVVAFAERAWEELYELHQSAWLATLESEVDNIRAALQWSLASDHILLGLQLAGASHAFWLASGRVTEGRGWSDRLLARAPAEAPDAAWKAAIARALGISGLLAGVQGDLSVARRTLGAAVELARQLDDRREIAFCLRWLGRVLIMEEAPDAACTSLEESLSLARELGDRATTVHALHGLAMAANQQADLEAANRLDQEALVPAREYGEALQIHLATGNLANVAIERGDLAAARRWLAESLAHVPKNGSHIAPMLEVFAHLAAVQSQPGRALRLAGAAAAARQDVSMVIPPRAKAVIQRRLEAARQEIDEQTAAAAWAEGQAMDLHAAMAYALAEPDTAAGAPDPPGSSGAGGDLTGREREVAVLLGHGLTNQQIAARLIITPGTAKRHVENILIKLDLTSRTQVATWATQRGWLAGDAPAS